LTEPGREAAPPRRVSQLAVHPADHLRMRSYPTTVTLVAGLIRLGTSLNTEHQEPSLCERHANGWVDRAGGGGHGQHLPSRGLIKCQGPSPPATVTLTAGSTGRGSEDMDSVSPTPTGFPSASHWLPRNMDIDLGACGAKGCWDGGVSRRGSINRRNAIAVGVLMPAEHTCLDAHVD